MTEQEIQSALNSFDTELQRTMGIIQYCKKGKRVDAWFS